MSDPAEPDGALYHSQTGQVPLLDTIDKLRTLGVGEVVALPQMIICGSKSNGKRSIIEAISRVGFPVRSDFHTGFVTEIILRRYPTPRFKVSIEPGPSVKSDKDLQRLKTFVPTVHANTEKSVSLIEKATEFIRPSFKDGFSDDVIKVEVSGPDQPNLTLIDMPRLYFTEYTDDGDQEKTPGRLSMEKYVLNSRSIILAVVSAKIDICAQKIIDFAEKYDAERKRIMGIVIHLDTLEASSDEEKLWLKGVKEATSKPPLGLHLVCTRSSETRDVPDDERDKMEREFFERGVWKKMGRQYVGTANLRRRLSTLLVNHIQSSLPGLISEIDKSILSTQSRLAKLSVPRQTIQQQKALLFNLSSAFQRITEQALSGMYTDDFFAAPLDDGKSKSCDPRPLHDPRRLRAIIRDLNEDFADVMEIAGCRQFIHGVNNQITSLLQPCNPYAHIRKPEHRNRSEFELDVSEQMRRDRGIEFPGCSNQLLVGSLFRDQSQPWEEIARVHLMKAWESTLDFVTLLLDHLADERMSVVIMKTIICPQLDRMEESLLAKVVELTASHKRAHPLPLSRSFLRGHSLPIDRSFLAKMQKSRNDRTLANVQQVLPSTMANTFNMEELRMAIQNLESASNQSAASDLIDQFQSYYNSALLIFIDNIANLGIENCLLGPLDGVLTTQTITNMEDSQIEELFAGVNDVVQKSRDHLTRELEKLKIGLHALSEFKVAKKTTPSIGTTEKPASGSAHGGSSSQSFLMPQGIICNSASANPFGVLCVGSSAQSQNSTPRYQLSWPYSSTPKGQDSVALCPSGPLGLNPGMVNPGVASAPSGSFLIADPDQSSRNSAAPASSRVTLPLSSALKRSTSGTLRPARFVPSAVPDTHGHDQNWYWEENDTHGNYINHYQSICYHDKFKSFSPEELRLADYQLDTRISSLFQDTSRGTGRKDGAGRKMKK